MSSVTVSESPFSHAPSREPLGHNQ